MFDFSSIIQIIKIILSDARIFHDVIKKVNLIIKLTIILCFFLQQFYIVSVIFV